MTRSRPSAGCGSCCGRAPSGRAAPPRSRASPATSGTTAQGAISGMVAVVILTAEGAGVGQGARPRRTRGGRSPPLSRSTTIGSSRSAGVSCIRSTSGSIDPKVRWPSAPSARADDARPRSCASVEPTLATSMPRPTSARNSRRRKRSMVCLPGRYARSERSGRFASTSGTDHLTLEALHDFPPGREAGREINPDAGTAPPGRARRGAAGHRRPPPPGGTSPAAPRASGRCRGRAGG